MTEQTDAREGTGWTNLYKLLNILYYMYLSNCSDPCESDYPGKYSHLTYFRHKTVMGSILHYGFEECH